MEKAERLVRERISFDNIAIIPKELATADKIGQVVKVVDGKFGCAQCLSGRDILFKLEENFARDMREIFRHDVVVTKDLKTKGIFEDVRVM